MLKIDSPTITNWRQLCEGYRRDLTDPTPQMKALLKYVRDDIYQQFEENQGTWKPLSKTTVKEKRVNQKDARILHRTPRGQGLRLKEAYRQAGLIDESGQIVYSYPDKKPYAVEHQEGQGVPERPLDFMRVINSDDAKIILYNETMKIWSEIFGWDNVQYQDLLSVTLVEE